MVSPPASRTALVGEGAALLADCLLVKYWKTTCFDGVTSTVRECPESVRRVSPLGNLLAKATTERPVLSLQTIFPACVISMALLFSSSAIKMWPLGNSSALFGAFRAPGPDAGP